MKKNKNYSLEALGGLMLIYMATEIFQEIDYEFRGVKSGIYETGPTELEMCSGEETDKGVTVRDEFFNFIRTGKSLKNLCLTQNQDVRFCKKYGEDIAVGDRLFFLLEGNDDNHLVIIVEKKRGGLKVSKRSLNRMNEEPFSKKDYIFIPRLSAEATKFIPASRSVYARY